MERQQNKLHGQAAQISVQRKQLVSVLPAEEHEARLKAEALSEDQVQRLAVHSEQVAEYAEQKATDLSQLKSQVRPSLQSVRLNVNHFSQRIAFTYSQRSCVLE